MFINFAIVLNTSRSVTVGIAQEVVPKRDHVVELFHSEFEQMMEFFVPPAESQEWMSPVPDPYGLVSRSRHGSGDDQAAGP